MIHKTFVERRFNRGETDIVTTVGKDVAQTLYLLLAVAEYENLKPVGQEMAERIGYDVEVLMI